MASARPRNSITNVSLVTAMALVMMAGWSNLAQAAASSVVSCDGEVRDLASLDVSTEALTVNRVDHPASDSEPASLETVEAQSDINDVNAPFLYLTPRVADLLRNVFQSAGDDNAVREPRSVPSSPVADRQPKPAGKSESMERDNEVKPSVGVNEGILPRFQQQMYRKDI